MGATTQHNEQQEGIGRLTAFGIDKEAPWQALLLAPNRYLDLRNIVTHRGQVTLTEEGQPAVLQGIVSRPAEYDPIKKRSRMKLRLLEDDLEVPVMAFGHPSQMPGDWRRVNSQVCMHGNLIAKPDGFIMLFAPSEVPSTHVGKALGVYPSKQGVIGGEKVRDRVLAQVTRENMPHAIAHIRERLAPYTPGQILQAWGEVNHVARMGETNLARIIYRMHFPTSPQQGMMAKQVIRHIEALGAILSAERERPKTGVFSRVVAGPQALQARIDFISHTPTDEQLQAVNDSLEDMASGKPMHRVLSGDVGTGKTTVFALLAAAVYDAGGEVAIMLPSSDMVNQVARDMTEWWPDITIEKVTGKAQADSVDGARIKVGTTALLHRFGEWRPTLTVVDEEQKYSVDQRQQLVAGGGHLMECTATCMPRTMAQIQFGLVPVSRLTKAHTPKTITTQIRDAGNPEEQQALHQDLVETLQAGGQTLVIFAARDAKEADKIASAPVAEETTEDGAQLRRGVSPTDARVIPLEEGFAAWEQAGGPGNVVALHGKMKAAERKASIDAMRNGEAQVLCATTAAEVGLNLTKLRQVIIYNAERLGLTQLHQIRGRVARLGGEGRCDLYVDLAHLSEKALTRLKALCDTQDGFALAEMDMQQRGLGDLSAKVNMQSGASDGGILRNSKLALVHFEVAQLMLDALGAPDLTAGAQPVARPPAPVEQPVSPAPDGQPSTTGIVPPLPASPHQEPPAELAAPTAEPSEGVASAPAPEPTRTEEAPRRSGCSFLSP